LFGKGLKERAMNFYKHHIGDYRRDTSHLTLLEHGAYRQLLDTYYLHEERIPLETDLVFRRLSARTEEEKQAVLTVLSEFFTRTDSGWMHTRCDAELEEYHAKVDIARLNGQLGGRPKKTDPVISGNPEETGSKANHKPRTINQEKKTPQVAELFPDVSDQVLADFVTLRKSLRAPITQLAADGIKREAAKAGLTLEQALTMCIERSWRGFKAEWVKDKPTTFDWDKELEGAV
jgi:uncharacterized protein YdaU (DUF1376 family)